jgi:type II secretory pathway pseudopilin PulG
MTLTHAEASHPSRRQGLTLLELLVVMVILIALGGIVLSMLPNFLTKTHDATTVTNIAEVNKAMMGFLSTNLSYPDQFDSIVDNTGAIYSKAIFGAATYTPTTGGGDSPVFTLSSLSQGQANSLTAGGINNLMVMKSATTNATFDAYLGLPTTTGAMTPVTASTKVMVVADNYVYQKLNMPQRTDSQGNLASYVMFGLGQYCTIVGSTSFGIFEAPISFGEHTQEQPTNSYARLLCVFRVYNDGARAEFVGCAHPDATGLGTADMHMQEYYQTK